MSSRLLADVAVLDGALTLGLPAKTTASSGVDAMVHAIEGFTCRGKNPVSDCLALQAMALLGKHLGEVHRKPWEVESRQEVLVGACLAGIAFNNSPVGAVHALAYPLGTLHGLSHGLSTSLMLPPVLRFNQTL